MIVAINGVQHNVPSDISQVSLGRFVEYYEKYGRQLDEELMAIFESDKDDFEKEIDFELHIDKEALSWYSFFTGFNFFESNEIDLTDILLQYRITRSLLKESENAARDFPMEIELEGEKWCIQDFRVTPGSTMNFNEIVTGKEVVRQITKLGQGKWEALAYLCCIYLRKKDEIFTDKLLEDRMEFMNNIPLNHALSVAFFLNSSISIFRKHLVSSAKVAVTKTQHLN